MVVWEEMGLLVRSSSPTGLYSTSHSHAAPVHLLNLRHVLREQKKTLGLRENSPSQQLFLASSFVA